MANANVLRHLTEKCDIYFEGSLISKEMIIKKYADFLVSALSGEDDRSVSVALHTGSACFDIVSLITAALGCIYIDDAENENIIESLQIGDYVLYGQSQRERYIWRGFADKNYHTVSEKIEEKGHYAMLEQPTKLSTTFVPKQSWHLITPYNGGSRVTDGRGIRKQNANRNNFISYMYNVPSETVPSVTGVSAVIVSDRSTFDRLSKGLEIIYDGDKHIGLLDIVTASYFADSGEEYQFGSNPAKAEPVLKITGKVSTARDLVLDKRGNKAIGMMVIGLGSLSKGDSELTDLLGRKSLRFAHVAARIDSESAENLVETQESATIFACTKEFLLQNSLPPQAHNRMTTELDKQVENIINNVVTAVTVSGGCSWEELKKTREALYLIKKSDWNEDRKGDFIVSAYSLLNLFTTATFTMQQLENAIVDGKLNTGVVSPALRIRELWLSAEAAGGMEYTCAFVADVLERLYESLSSQCPKYDTLAEHIDKLDGRKVVVIVPRAYYITILNEDAKFNRHNVSIVTANRFDGTIDLDEVVVVGDFYSKKFDPLKCRAAADVIVLLYECETHTFRHKKCKAGKFEKTLNSRLGVIDDDSQDNVSDSTETDKEFEEMSVFSEDTSDLERYIDSISLFDIGKFAARATGAAGTAPTSEVCAIGKFSSGEQILFSKYYNAVVFNSEVGTVIETDVEKLNSGDLLVFARRDDYTRNMVDFIYESLQTTKRLSEEVLDSTEKAFYWKEALREYKNINGLTYRDVARKLRKVGSSLQEVTIRQWLIEESHIVGPRDEKTLEQIAELTQDPFLLEDAHSFYEACRIVRHQRKEILSLIGKAITDKLSGHLPKKGSLLEIVYENVENLSETLELENVSVLGEPISVPINIINKPITDSEVSI